MSVNSQVCVIGDVHGHLQLALGVAARWQDQMEKPFEAVLICGDISAFSSVDRIDRATRRFAKLNPCELEFPTQWMKPDSSPWLRGIWAPREEGGLGLDAPVIVTYGNHEDFDLIAKSTPDGYPLEPVAISDLRSIDPGGRILLLPSGWRVRLPSGLVVGAIGGIQPGQRPKAGYPPMAYIDPEHVDMITQGGPVDVLITHQGPAVHQGYGRGSEQLNKVLDSGKVRSMFHGHSVGDPDIRTFNGCKVTPLHGIPFRTQGSMIGQPGVDSWCAVEVSPSGIKADRRRPDCWSEFHRSSWIEMPGAGLVAPALAGWHQSHR